jgi:nucleoside-diphosphate-sugar epimerase
MKIMVTGASGFVGQQLCSTLLSQDLEVTGTVRKLPEQPIPGVSYRVVEELSDKTDWREALNDAEIVEHCATRVHIMHDKAASPLAELRETKIKLNFGGHCLPECFFR